MWVWACGTHCHLLIQSREQDLDSSGVVVHSLLACVNLSKVHVLAVTNMWTQLHGMQKNLRWNVKEDKSTYGFLKHLATIKNVYIGRIRRKTTERIFLWLYACFQVQSKCVPACRELGGCWTQCPGLVGRRDGPFQNQRCLCIPLSVPGMMKHESHADH